MNMHPTDIWRNRIKRALGKAFPLIAVFGVLMAGYVLVLTPEEVKGGQELSNQGLARWSASHAWGTSLAATYGTAAPEPAEMAGPVAGIR